MYFTSVRTLPNGVGNVKRGSSLTTMVFGFGWPFRNPARRYPTTLSKAKAPTIPRSGLNKANEPGREGKIAIEPNQGKTLPGDANTPHCIVHTNMDPVKHVLTLGLFSPLTNAERGEKKTNSSRRTLSKMR